MAQNPARAHPFRSTALHVAFAVVAMGGWAAFVNRGFGPQAAAIAFAVQGAMSGLITLIMKRALEGGNARLTGLTARLLPPLVSCIVIAGVLIGGHTLAGTPDVLATVAVPWMVSTVYAFVYTAGLGRT